MVWPNITEFLKQKAGRYGEAPLLKDYQGGGCYSYRSFDETSDRLAWGLRQLGIAKGERVAFVHKNHSDLLLGYLAVIKAGGVAVPINPVYTPAEIGYIVANSGARLLISAHEHAGQIAGLQGACPGLQKILVKAPGQSLEEALTGLTGVPGSLQESTCTADDPAMLFYTSGTTGKPKGVIITHRNITFGGGNTAQNYGLLSSDVTLICLPLTHIFANATPFWGTVCSGGCAVVMERFQSEAVFDAIEKYGLTWFPGVPTMFNFLLSAFDQKPRKVSSLRMGLSGAASLATVHLKAFEKHFGASMLEVYGLTESTGLVTANPVYGVRKAGSIGIAVSGVAVRLVDGQGREVMPGEIGELIFKGPNAAAGYWNLPEQTATAIRDGWIYTGDLAYQDGEGYFFITSRKNELIISGGYNIYPREIEEVLLQAPGVGEAAVVGLPDAALGEVPRAFVVPQPGAALTAEELTNFCRGRLAPYKIPKAFEIRSDLPRNSTGKIMKTELKNS